MMLMMPRIEGWRLCTRFATQSTAALLTRIHKGRAGTLSRLHWCVLKIFNVKLIRNISCEMMFVAQYLKAELHVVVYCSL